ncbi:MAG: nuclear transport factor 2 family protein [Proteobacteria bacterium]|nr:nuclear transport factor 2 family protein [Pseudomonadota bacterium]
MGTDREQLLRSYWAIIEQEQNYSALSDFYLPESVLIDPLYGEFKGHAAIKAFLEKVTADMHELDISFTVAEVAGEGDIGWSRWCFQLPDGNKKEGVSVYRFKGDKILYQHDYIGTNELG